MQLSTKLTQILPIQTGTGNTGEWKKQDIIVEIQNNNELNIIFGQRIAGAEKKLCISIWDDKINQDQLKIGDLLKIDFDIESREFNNKWYTDIKAWKIEVASTSAQDTPYNTINTNDFISNGEDYVLPF